MPDIGAPFLLPGAARRDPAVESWFDAPDPFRRMLRPWFDRMRACGDDVREIMHDRCPNACAGEAAFAYVAAYRAHAAIGFFHGASLPDPAGLLEGTGKRMRHVKLRLEADRDETALTALIAAGYEAAKEAVRGQSHG